MSRVYKVGSIYSRVEGLIRNKHLKEKDKPIWFDVYKRFPPKYEPVLKRKAPEMEIKDIFYKEDVLRAKIHKALNNRLGVFDLNSDKESMSQNLLKTCQNYISEGMSEEEAIKKLNLQTELKTSSVKSAHDE